MKGNYFFLGIAGIFWQIVFFYIPLLLVIALSFSGSSLLEHFRPFISMVYGKIIVRSLLLALVNATLCTLIAYPLAYFLAFRAGKLKNFLLFLVILPFWNNFLLHIYAWIFVLDRHGVLNTLLKSMGVIQEPLHLLNSVFATTLMMVYFYVPFMVLPLYATLERFDKRLIESSLDLGASWWQTIYRILLPVTMPGIRAGFFLVFIPSFGEFAIPEFMGGDKSMYVGTVVSNLMLGSQTAGLGAAFTVLSALVLMVVAYGIYWAMGKFIKVS
jgi:spermidine/putrescine transport system permease protein